VDGSYVPVGDIRQDCLGISAYIKVVSRQAGSFRTVSGAYMIGKAHIMVPVGERPAQKR
jgi:hypothetical protein